MVDRPKSLSRHLAGLIIFGAVLIVGPDLLAAAGGARHTAQVGTGLFGTLETRSDKTALFPKWTGTLERYFAERSLGNRPCTDSRFNKCHLQRWSAYIESLKGLSRMDQMRLVQHYFRNIPYVIDPKNYGVADYWATPNQLLTRNGDCEDYAIAKFLSLRALGFPNADLRVVVVQDMNLRAPHAVLVVFHKGFTFVLDNQIRNVMPALRIHHYRPLYSINETHWWLHRASFTPRP